MREHLTGQMVKEAAAAVGTTANERARWLLKFLRQDPIALRGLERMSLQLALFTFLTGRAAPIRPGRQIPPGILATAKEIEQCWAYAIGFLQAFEKKRFWSMTAIMSRNFSRDGDRVEIEAVPAVDRRRAFREAVLETLQAAQAHLRFCANTSCDALFVRSGKWKYCSHRCEETTSKRRHRQRVKARPVTVTNQ